MHSTYHGRICHRLFILRLAPYRSDSALSPKCDRKHSYQCQHNLQTKSGSVLDFYVQGERGCIYVSPNIQDMLIVARSPTVAVETAVQSDQIRVGRIFQHIDCDEQNHF